MWRYEVELLVRALKIHASDAEILVFYFKNQEDCRLPFLGIISSSRVFKV